MEWRVASMAFRRLFPLIHDSVSRTMWRMGRVHVGLCDCVRLALYTILFDHHDHWQSCGNLYFIYSIKKITQQWILFSIKKIKNLFIALLLSSFGSDRLKDVKDDEINKIQEAVDRIRRFFRYLSRKLASLTKTNTEFTSIRKERNKMFGKKI